MRAKAQVMKYQVMELRSRRRPPAALPLRRGGPPSVRWGAREQLTPRHRRTELRRDYLAGNRKNHVCEI